MKIIACIVLFLTMYFAATYNVACAEMKIVFNSEGKVIKKVYNPQMGSSSIMLYDDQTKQLTDFYSLTDSKGCHINDLSIDPSGKHIAFSGFCRLSKSDDCQKKPSGYYRIIVADSRTGEEIVILDHGTRFSLSPQGDAIVYEEDYPGSDERCQPPPGIKGGIWIYNFKSKQLHEIDSKVGASHFVWSEYDGNIYFSNNSKIFRYDPDAKNGAIVDIPGIYFSNDGKYNLSARMGGTKVYRVSDGKPVDYVNDSLKRLGRIALYSSWALNDTAILVTSGSMRYHVLDLQSGEVVREFQGRVIGRNHAGTKFLINPIVDRGNGRKGIDRQAMELIEIKPEK